MTAPQWTPRVWNRTLLCPVCDVDWCHLIDYTAHDLILECPQCGAVYGATTPASPARKEAS